MASIYNQTTGETEAKLIEFIGDPEIAGARLVRGWTEIAGYAASGNTVNELVLTLNGVKTYTDPKANGKTYGGTYVNSVTKATDEYERSGAARDCQIIQTLTLVQTVANSAALLALTPRVHKKNTITHPFELNQGEHDLYEYFYDNLNPASATALMTTITDKQLLVGLALATVDPDNWTTGASYTAGKVIENPGDSVVYICRANHTAGATFAGDRREGLWVPYWTYVDRDFRQKDDGTATFIVTLRKTAYIMTGNEERRWTRGDGKRDESETILYPNVDGYYAQIVMDDAKTNADDMTAATPAAPANHVLVSLDRIPSGEGKYDVIRVTSAPAGGGAYEAWPGTPKNHPVTRTVYRRIRSAGGVETDYKRTYTFNVSIRRLLLQSNAAAHCSGGEMWPEHALTTGYFQKWIGKYIATKINLTDSGAWAEA